MLDIEDILRVKNLTYYYLEFEKIKNEVTEAEYEMMWKGVISGEDSEIEQYRLLVFYGDGGEIVKRCSEK